MPRFTISNLLVFVTAICVILCAWQISVCRGLLEEKSKRLAYLESRRRLTDLSIELLTSFDNSNKQDREDFLVVQWLLNILPASPRPGTSPQDDENILAASFATQFQLVAFGEDKEFELLTLNYNSLRVPGSGGTALVLFQRGKVVDRVVRYASTRDESSRDISIADINSDGKPDVTIDILPGIWYDQSGNLRATYKTTDTGFSRVENLNTKKAKTRKDQKKANSGSQQNDSSGAQLNSR